LHGSDAGCRSGGLVGYRDRAPVAAQLLKEAEQEDIVRAVHGVVAGLSAKTVGNHLTTIFAKLMAGAWTPGVGISSMRERAAEVGGTLQITRDKTGSQVRALLPSADPGQPPG
jgi:signal transduction histidine kinase